MSIDAISRTPYASATRQPVESRLAQEVKQTDRQETKTHEISQRKAEEAPLQPVVNAQGQATGALINVFA